MVIRGIIIALFAMLAACSLDGNEPTDELGSWELKLVVSGGIAGIQQQVTLNSTGLLSVVDKRQNIRQSRQISADKLQSISAQLAKLNVDKLENLETRRCADCVNYELSINNNHKVKQVRTDVVSISKTEYGELVATLAKLMRSVLN